MFRAAGALLASRATSARRHSGVLARIARDFVKTGILSREAGRRLHEAFELRQKADYRDFWEVDGEQAREILQAAEDFVREARTILEP